MIDDKRNIIEKDIPVDGGCIDVIVDGYPATIEITDEARSLRVLIKFNAKHLRWGDSFQSKYFKFEKSGEMSWGHDGEVMSIVRA
jgi:hypothetical protein